MKYLTNILDDAGTLPSKMTGIASVVNASAIHAKQSFNLDSQLESYLDFIKDNNLHVLLPIFMVMGAFGYVCEYIKRKCPDCDKKWGLRYQGTENKATGKGSWFFRDDYDLYKCDGCGHEEWKRTPTE